MNNTTTKKTIVTTSIGESEDYALFLDIKGDDKLKKDKALGELWKKYQPLVKKYKNWIKKNAMENHITADYVNPILEDYECSSAEPFMQAVNTIDLSRLQHMKGSWTFVYTFSGYLQRHNTKLIGHTKKIQDNETSGDKRIGGKGDGAEREITIFDTVEDNSYNPEEVYDRSMDSKILKIAMKKAYERFNSVQKSIWDTSVSNIEANTEKVFNRDGYEDLSSAPIKAKKNEVSTTLGMTTKELNNNLKDMKQILSSEVRRANREYNASVVW